MKIRFLPIILILLISISLTFAQSNVQVEQFAKRINPTKEQAVGTGKFAPKNFNRVSANQLGFTDYDYAGNSGVNEQVWPYDIDGDGVLDPVCVWMQRFNTSEDGTRRVMISVGLGGEFASFDASDRTFYTGWGTVQSITAGPWAGHAAIMMHEGGEAKLSVLDLTDFSFLYFHQDLDMDENFPTFSYLDDGTVSATLTDASFRVGDVSIPTIYNEVGQSMVVGPSEYPIRRSPNGQYLAAVSDDGGVGVYMYISSDGGENWAEELIGENEVSEIVNRPGALPLFTNFGQRSIAVDNNGVVHVGMNGYSLFDNGVDTTFTHPALYWNSRDRNWVAVSDPAEEGEELSVDGVYPGNGVGNAYPTPIVSEDGSVVSILYQAPEYVGGALQIYPGDGGPESGENYYTDIKHAYSIDGGATFSSPEVVAGNPGESDVYPAAYDWLIEDGNEYTVHFMWMTDAIPGTSLFTGSGENGESEDTYWSYETFTFNAEAQERTTWSADIEVFDAAGRAGEVLKFGQKYNATNGLDAGLGESELPPLPPSGAFDSRFIFPDGLTASLIDYRSNELDAAEWTLKFQPGAAGYPITLQWDPSDFVVTGSWRLTDAIDGSLVNVDMTNTSQYTLNNAGITSLKITFSKETCLDLTHFNGWNLISLPVVPADNSKDVLFPNSTSNAFLFNNGYQIAENLNTGIGYWLKFDGSGSTQICGLPVSHDINVKAGWNMIGVFQNSVDIDQVTSTPVDIVTSNFFEFNNGYQIVETLTAGGGYWVKVNQDGVLHLNTAAKGNNSTGFTIDESWTKVQIEDSHRMRALLFLTSSEIGEMGAMPPKPPTGIFDVRFTNDRFAETVGDKWHTLEISGENYPLTITAVDGDLDVKVTNGDQEKVTTLLKDESLTLNKKHSLIQLKSTSSLPVEFNLAQNYPNPFNPSTTIEFSLPKELNVKVSVYNALGQKVISLVNTKMNAGYHSVEFNASNLSSGVYFYKIQAGEFNQVKKMLLVK